MKAARIVVLTVAIAAGGVAALLAGRSARQPAPKPAPVVNADTVDVLVAKIDIGVGRKITPGDVAWQPWPAKANTGNFIRRKQHPNAIEGLSGSIVRAPFVAGEPIRRQKLIQGKGSGYMAAILPSGMRAISIGVSPETGASGFILPNDHVDVVLTSRDRRAEMATGTETFVSRTILSDVRVLAIGQQVGEKNGQKVVIGKTATLELTPKQVESVELARKTGTLSLALRSIADIGKRVPKAESDGQNERDAVNVVRFGVTTASTPH
ncbi:MAG: Flp pilus assembly protein CpaB [Pseudolabrys sp.]